MGRIPVFLGLKIWGGIILKKTLSIIMSILLIAALFSLAGCGKSNTESTPSDQAKTSDKAGTSDPSELQKLFKSSSAVKGFSYDMETTMSGPDGNMVTTGKYYVSGKKVRMEMETQGMKTIMLYNGGSNAYMYTPATNTAMKAPMPKEKSAGQWAESDEDLAKFKVVGHEKMGGYDCLVVTTTEEQSNAKTWLREDNGLPVRIETSQGDNKSVSEFKNYKIGAQADSLFELPAGAKVMDIPNMPQGQNMPPMPQGAQ